MFPIGSMYGIFAYIWLIFMGNVGKYTIHGSYGFQTGEIHSRNLPNLKLHPCFFPVGYRVGGFFLQSQPKPPPCWQVYLEGVDKLTSFPHCSWWEIWGRKMIILIYHGSP